MKVKQLLLIAGGLACIAGGFFLAQRVDRTRSDEVKKDAQQGHEREMASLRNDAASWAEAVAKADGESVLKAFVAGISPAILAQRRESIELAAVALLRVTGVAGIHVLGTSGDILYSSDAKLTTTGNAQYRGEWALQAAGLVSRPSTRPGVVEFATPIESGGTRLAVAWLEYDVALVRDAARPPSFRVHSAPDASPQLRAEKPPGQAPPRDTDPAKVADGSSDATTSGEPAGTP